MQCQLLQQFVCLWNNNHYSSSMWIWSYSFPLSSFVKPLWLVKYDMNWKRIRKKITPMVALHLISLRLLNINHKSRIIYSYRKLNSRNILESYLPENDIGALIQRIEFFSEELITCELWCFFSIFNQIRMYVESEDKFEGFLLSITWTSKTFLCWLILRWASPKTLGWKKQVRYKTFYCFGHNLLYVERSRFFGCFNVWKSGAFSRNRIPY